MDREKLKQIAKDAIDEDFKIIELVIDDIIDDIVHKIIENHEIEDVDDIDYLKTKIKHGIFLKWDENFK